MINGVGIKSAVEQCGSPEQFVGTFREMLGLDGTRQRTYQYDSLRLRSAQESWNKRVIRPEDVSLRELAFGMLGIEAPRILAEPHRERDVQEAGTAIVPSQFANISAFNSAVAGLLEAKMLEVWQRPEFIAYGLVDVIPSRKKSEKFIGISDIGDIAEERKPGKPHARAKLSERYVTTPDTVNRGAGIDVTREAVMFDESGQLMQQAESVSEALLLRREYLILDVILGITAAYTYGGTSSGTYQTATPWINDIAKNIVNWTDIEEILLMFVTMSSQETSEPISVGGNQVLCMPSNWGNIFSILNPGVVERRTASAAEIMHTTNPVGHWNVQMVGGPLYPYAYKRAIASDGLALSAANAKQYTYWGDFRRAFCYVENMPLTISRVSADDYTMADHGLVLSLFADEMGVAGVKEPRHVIRCINE